MRDKINNLIYYGISSVMNHWEFLAGHANIPEDVIKYIIQPSLMISKEDCKLNFTLVMNEINESSEILSIPAVKMRIVLIQLYKQHRPSALSSLNLNVSHSKLMILMIKMIRMNLLQHELLLSNSNVQPLRSYDLVDVGFISPIESLLPIKVQELHQEITNYVMEKFTPVDESRAEIISFNLMVTIVNQFEHNRHITSFHDFHQIILPRIQTDMAFRWKIMSRLGSELQLLLKEISIHDPASVALQE